MQPLDTLDKIVILIGFFYVLYLIHDALTVRD
jgi:hypothetical protein